MDTNFLSRLKSAGKRKESQIEFEGCTFIVRDMTGLMRDSWDADAKKRVQFKGRNPDLNTMNLEGQRALLIAMTLVDDTTGELAFDYKSADDLGKIGELSGALIEVLFEEALDLCGISAKSSEESEGN